MILKKITGFLTAFMSSLIQHLFKYTRKILHRNFNPFGLGQMILPPIEVLHESENYIVVNKLPDIVINDVDRSRVTVEQQLAVCFPEIANNDMPFRYYFAHRIDYSTSGVLIIAKNKKACAAAVTAFQKRKALKYYLAIIRGHLLANAETLNHPIGWDLQASHRMAMPCIPNCTKSTKPAKTHLIVLERGSCYNSPATKVILRPVTGRRHQLRLHCLSMGHPIVGDYTYGDDEEPHRMFLHAWKIEIPCGELETLNVTSPDPFTTKDSRNSWVPTEFVKSLDEAVEELGK